MFSGDRKISTRGPTVPVESGLVEFPTGKMGLWVRILGPTIQVGSEACQVFHWNGRSKGWIFVLHVPLNSNDLMFFSYTNFTFSDVLYNIC